MAFWKRKKRHNDDPSKAAASASPPVTDPPAPPPPPVPPATDPVAPPTLKPDAPIIDRDGLVPGAFTLEELAFRPVALPEVPEPFVDPDRPTRRRGAPNWSVGTLIDHLREAVRPLVDDLEKLLVFTRGGQHPHFAFVYTRNRQILPVWFDGQAMNAWIRVLSEERTDFQLSTGSSSGSYSSGSAISLDLETDPAAFMLRCAPDRWAGADDAPAKQQLLDNAIATNSARASVDPSVVATTWRALIEATGAQPNPPASDAQVAAFETATGLSLPEELLSMVQVHNGADGALMVMMSLEQMLVEWKNWKQIFDEWPLQELLGHSSCPTEEALGIYTTPYWIPLVDERTGNFAALDLAPGPNGQSGQIIYFGADESGSIRVLASDLGDFLQRQLDYVHAEIAAHGEWDPNESGGFYLN